MRAQARAAFHKRKALREEADRLAAIEAAERFAQEEEEKEKERQRLEV